MFTIRAGYTDKIEVKANCGKVREFFSEIENFLELMPNIESIHKDGKGIVHWKIRTNIPLYGSFAEKFAVDIAEDNEDRTEWIPVEGESKNFLRYAVDYFESGKNKTLIRYSQSVEMRRKYATEFHLLAPLAGESLISSEMGQRLTEMVRTFVQRARIRLEET